MRRFNLLKHKSNPRRFYERLIREKVQLPEVVLEGGHATHFDGGGYILPDLRADQSINRSIESRQGEFSEWNEWESDLKRAVEERDERALKELFTYGPGPRLVE